MNQEQQSKKMNQIIAKCCSDDTFKQQLLADPALTLKAAGISLPDGFSVKVVENTDKLVHVLIPAKPTDLSEEDLDNLSGGFGAINASLYKCNKLLA
jgi:hypothetical protein